MDTLHFSMIAAAAENNVIGQDNKLLWDIPEDMNFFRTKTRGAPIIVGRKTLESIQGYNNGKLLPGRTHIVVTTQKDYTLPEGHYVCHSMKEAFEKAKDVAKAEGAEEVFCIGGAEIYKVFMEYATRIYLTRIQRSFEGDTCFPEIDKAFWTLIEQKPQSDQEHPLTYNFETWERKLS